MRTGSSDQLGQAPETDAEHCAWAEDFARDLSDLADALREHREILENEGGQHASVMAGLDEAAEHLSEAASSMSDHLQDYLSAYEGVREVAEHTDGKLPGGDPNGTYWANTR